MSEKDFTIDSEIIDEITAWKRASGCAGRCRI